MAIYVSAYTFLLYWVTWAVYEWVDAPERGMDNLWGLYIGQFLRIVWLMMSAVSMYYASPKLGPATWIFLATLSIMSIQRFKEAFRLYRLYEKAVNRYNHDHRSWVER